MVLEFLFGLEKFRAFTVEEDEEKKRGIRRREEKKEKKKEEGKDLVLVGRLFDLERGL